jgi:RNA polymerase sigma factor for flagellar operon FliA
MAVEAPSVESVFVENLPVLERVVAGLGRRYGMSADEIAELSSTIKLRIVEDDYAVFRKFRGDSSLSTYLTVVITMMAREARVAERGRWRPSAAAQRLGPAAVGLETLVHQKGYALAEAAEVMRSRGETTLSDRELGDLLRQLPRRAPMRPVAVGAEPLRETIAAEDAEANVAADEASRRRTSVKRALGDSLAALSLEDRLLLKLRFWQDASIADAARILGVEQRPLYRRLEKILNDLRGQLAGEGVTSEQVRELIGEMT